MTIFLKRTTIGSTLHIVVLFVFRVFLKGGIMGHLGHKIKLIDRQFRSRMDKNLENLGITTAQMNVLCYMEHHAERNVTQKQLSEAFNGSILQWQAYFKEWLKKIFLKKTKS